MLLFWIFNMIYLFYFLNTKHFGPCDAKGY
jgi:hypothetical protein